MKLENLKISNINQYLRGVYKHRLKKIDEMEKYVSGSKQKLMKDIKQKHTCLSLAICDKKLKEPNIQTLVAKIKKNKQILPYYSDKGLINIIEAGFHKILNQKKSLNLLDDDFESMERNIIENIITLKEKTYSFQILNFKFNGKEIKNGSCKLITFDFKKEKGYGTPFHKLIPPLYLKFNNFVKVQIFGNDNDVDYNKSLQLAENFVNLLKLRYNRSPNVRLCDTYLVPFKDGWTSGYRKHDVLHWDMELHKKEEIGIYLEKFAHIINEKNRCQLFDKISASLSRFSNSLSIYHPSFRLSEMVGALESLLTKRSDARKKESNIPKLITQRVKKLFKGNIQEDRVEAIFNEYYDIRSEYSHQSNLLDVEKKIQSVISIYLEILSRYVEFIDRFQKKDDLINYLDS